MIRTVLLVFLLPSILLLGCTNLNNNLLQWSSKKGQIITYQAVITEFPPDKELSISALQLSKAFSTQRNRTNTMTEGIPLIYFKVADELAVQSLSEDMSLIGTVTTKSPNVLEVKLIGAPTSSITTPQTKKGRRELKIRQLRAGSIQLLADIDLSGNLISFYLNRKQKNMVSLLFKLPNKPVVAGDSWDIPVQLISTGNGYIVDEKQQFTRALLLSTNKNNHGDYIAKILFVVHEYVEGIYQFKATLDPTGRPFSIDASYIGYGELLINKGYWLRHIGQMAVKGTGHAPFNVKKLQAMVFQEVK